MKYKNLVFDLDGTLLDTLGDITDALNLTLSEFDIDKIYTEAETRYLVGSGARMIIERALAPFHFSHTRNEQIIARFITIFHQSSQIESSRIYPGMGSLLERAQQRGIKLFVLTNKPQAIAERVVRHYFNDMFTAIIGNQPPIPVKPDPTLLLKLINDYQLDKQSTLFIGDTDVDLATAANAGLDACWVSYGYRTLADLGKSRFKYLVDNATDLERFI